MQIFRLNRLSTSILPDAKAELAQLKPKPHAINTKEKTVTIATKEGATETLPYDSLVIATGADSFMPPIKGKEKPGNPSLRGIEDGEKIDAPLKQAPNQQSSWALV